MNTLQWRSCTDCGQAMPKWRRRHVKRDCPGYSDLWAGDLRMKFFGALKSYRSIREKGGLTEDVIGVLMVTVTAPGQDDLPWDSDRCRGLGPHRHSGLLGCRIRPTFADPWNASAPDRWRALNGTAARHVERDFGHRAALLSRVWEVQSRGALHVHALLGYSTPTERASADRYVEELKSRAGSHGFGQVDRSESLKSVTAAAAYLAGYFANGKGRKMALTESVTKAEMPRSIAYVRPELSQHSGLTMQSLRLRRFLWHRIGSDGLRLAGYLEVNLEECYHLFQEGFWGRTFFNSRLADLRQT